MFPFTTDEPTDIPTEPWEATPGIEGFLLGFFFLGIALAFLMWSMNRHLRKIKHSASAERRKAAERTVTAHQAEGTAGQGDPVEGAPDERTPGSGAPGETEQADSPTTSS